MPTPTRNLVTLAEHTVDVDLIAPGGWVLDAGCRNFAFSRAMAERGCNVLAIDADPAVRDPDEKGIHYFNVAVAERPGVRELVLTSDPQARYLAPEGVSVMAERVTVPAFTLDHLATLFGVREWEVVKLDVEGSEYGILRTWPGPIAKQLSIEFHEHVCPQPQAVYDEIFAHLGKWYDVVQHEKENLYTAGMNWWNSLLCRR